MACAFDSIRTRSCCVVAVIKKLLLVINDLIKMCDEFFSLHSDSFVLKMCIFIMLFQARLFESGDDRLQLVTVSIWTSFRFI